MNQDSIIKALLIVIIILLIGNLALLAVWGVVSITTDKPTLSGDGPAQTEKGTTKAETNDLPVSGTPDSSALLGESADMGQEYIDSIIFLGDSTTSHMKSREVLTGGKNTKQIWTGAAGWLNLDASVHKTTILYPKTGTEMTVAEAAALEKPKYMVITLGADYGVAYCDQTKFTTYYGKLIDAIKQASPDTKIILQSVFPVAAHYENKVIEAGKEATGLTNRKIDIANTWIMQLAAQKGCKYLDTASVLKNSNGALIDSYESAEHGYDGIHINTEAYRAILQYIRTHGYTD